ncbi:MAG TPA: GIY-YIG nuclease family protein [Verrucomicrobiae bacterium]|nr:GIY-YIG nuclease family protein [Verrucomicrobiae bacterium]
MGYYLYILRSRIDGKLYVGQTKNLARRLELHNLGAVKSTRRRMPFDLVWAEEFSSRGEAIKKERFLKSLEGSTFKKALVEKFCGSNSAG